MKTDILAFGAHPDDVELAASGTIAAHVALGKKVVVVDLTRGELGTRGNAALRAKEAEASSKLLGLQARVNLDLGDGFFEINEMALLRLIEQIRYYRPEIVLCNAVADRHPDHGRAGELASRACFLSGLIKIETSWNGNSQEAWRPKAVYHYIQDRYLQPDIIVDISEHAETKLKSIACFSSQFFNPDSDEPVTPISTPEFMDHIKSRMVHFGRLINARYGEGFTVERPAGVNDLTSLI